MIASWKVHSKGIVRRWRASQPAALMKIPRLLLWSALVAAPLSLQAVHAQGVTVEDVQLLSSLFEPNGELINRGDGYFYAAARWSSSATAGVIFRFAPGSDAEVLYTFGTLADASETNYGGSNPSSGLVLGADGAFYGTTSHGGAHARGTIYRISPDGVFSVLHDINPAVDGWESMRLIATPGGDLYGTMTDGGSLGGGTIYRIGTDGVFETVHAFESPESFPPGTEVPPGTRFEFSLPIELILGKDGKIYGTTGIGGPVHASGNFRLSYGGFFRLEDTGSLTMLSEFDAIEERIAKLVPTGNGFYSNTDEDLLHLSYTGTLTEVATIETPETGMTGLTSPVEREDGLYGLSYYGGEEDGGFIYKHVAGEGTTILYNFPADYRNRRKWLFPGNDGLLYGLTAYPESEVPEAGAVAASAPRAAKKKKKRLSEAVLPKAFRLRPSGADDNLVPLAKSDIAWLPVKAKDGVREVQVNVLTNDKDPDGGSLAITNVEAPEGLSTEVVSTPKGPQIRVRTSVSHPSSAVVTYQLEDGQGGSSTGTLSIKSPASGVFAGQATAEGVPAAALTVKLGKQNSVTATLVIGGKKYSGSGKLDVSDSADLSLKAKGKTPVNLHIGLLRGASPQVIAVAVDGQTTYSATCTAK
jgi:uncharacterized repeat protein (TIGR03803 family)